MYKHYDVYLILSKFISNCRNTKNRKVYSLTHFHVLCAEMCLTIDPIPIVCFSFLCFFIWLYSAFLWKCGIKWRGVDEFMIFVSWLRLFCVICYLRRRQECKSYYYSSFFSPLVAILCLLLVRLSLSIVLVVCL